MPHFIVATAGHVDHGKSALVKALTGTDPDRLPEEKARGITIDLGFAHLELAAPTDDARPSTLDPRPSTFALGIVDVPGHEDFVKNMVAGVGSIDLALFVVAADDGWMPQTEEHLHILAYLGVTRAVVALTKIDLVEGGEDEVVAALRGQLKQTPFADAPIVPTSVITGRGIEELKVTLARVLAGTPAPRDIGKPRLAVDRVFTLRGIGTVVTGTLTGGTLRRGQSVALQPGSRATRIRSLQNHNRDVESIGPGSRTAINLPDVAKGTDEASAAGVRRGEVITLAESGEACATLDVVLEKSARLVGSKAAAARPLKDGALVRVHHGSSNVPARVLLLDRKQLGPGEKGLGQLRLESPIFVFTGDRFILRDWSEQATLAGGIVLEADATRRGVRQPAHLGFVERRAGAIMDAATCVESYLERERAARSNGLLEKSNFSVAEVTEAVARLAAQAKVVHAGEFVAHGPWWQAQVERAAAVIDAHHRAHPDQTGLSLNQLRSEMASLLPEPDLFNTLAADLCHRGFTQSGVVIHRATHRAALPPQLQAAGNRLRAALAAKPFEPPSRKELAPDAATLQALRFLLQTGEVIDLGEDLVLAADSFARMKEAIVQRIRGKGPATVSDLRQLFGTTRRVMMPLLERLDREGVTLRQGDTRTVRGKQTP